MSQKIFITYANEKFALSEKQLLKEARALGIFDKCIGYTPNDLPEFVKANPLMAFARGGGYWCWKPYIVWKTLQDYPDAIVVYTDAGCILNNTEEWNEWFEYMKTYDTLVMQYRKGVDYGWSSIYPGRDVSVDNDIWTKKALFDHYDQFFPDDKWHRIPQLWSGMIMATKQSKVVEEWFYLSLYYPELLFDARGAEVYEQSERFIEHRHDQSTLSVVTFLGLEKGWNIKVVPEVSESRTDAAVVTARRIIKPVSFMTRLVNRIKAIIGEDLYNRIHRNKKR